MPKREHFQELILKCETLLMEKLRGAKIRGKLSSPIVTLAKSQSEKDFVLSPKYSDSLGDKLTRGSRLNEDRTTDDYNHLNDRLSDIKREIRKEKSEKNKLKQKVEELQHTNRVKEEQLEHLKQNVSKLSHKIDKLEGNDDNKVIAFETKSRTKLQQMVSPKEKTSDPIKEIHREHNLYLEEKEQQLARFEEKMSHKNRTICGLEERIISLEGEILEFRNKSRIKETHTSSSMDSLKLMLSSNNDKLEAAIKEKSDLKETIKQLETKN